jgi:hypothetical protein
VKTLDFENEGNEKSLADPQKCVTGQMWGTDFSPFSISRVFTQSVEALGANKLVAARFKGTQLTDVNLEDSQERDHYLGGL